jgi:colanic acid biosynthesis glycosyl transferase WcaI
MRILLHDFPGHPFQAELARALGAEGHEVLHVRCASFPSGNGNVADDPGSSTRFEAIELRRPFERYALVQRLRQELEYARRFRGVLRRFRPDVVISSNDPLPSKAALAAWSTTHRTPWVFWLQDIWSVAMAREAEQRSRLGRVAGRGFQVLERGLLRHADAVIPITADFDPLLDEWGVRRARRTVIENWAPLAEVPPRPRRNEWADSQGLGDRPTFLYAGTLGLKHDPDVLHALAVDQPDADVVVISEGKGAERLTELRGQVPAPNLRILGFQPWDALPDVLAAADVLIVLLEEAAGTFSVPSKVLTSLCAGRTILAAMPASNLGARTIERAGAGVVVRPGDSAAFLAAARALRSDPAARDAHAAAGRRYAEETFDIEGITARFQVVLDGATATRRRSAARATPTG